MSLEDAPGQVAVSEPLPSTSALDLRVTSQPEGALARLGTAFDEAGRLVVTWEPTRDWNGLVEVQGRAGWRGSAPVGASQVAFTLQVEPVNDAPLLGPLGPVSLAEDSAGSIVLTGVGPGGGADEATQRVTVSAEFEPPDAVRSFSIEGAGSTRTLALQPVPDFAGPLALRLVLLDEGGTERGGQDTSRYEFPLEVAAVNDPPQFDMPLTRTVSVGRRCHVGLSRILAGPLTARDEHASQQVRFQLVPSDAAAFAHLQTPQVVGPIGPPGASRRVGFELSPGFQGDVELDVIANDDHARGQTRRTVSLQVKDEGGAPALGTSPFGDATGLPHFGSIVYDMERLYGGDLNADGWNDFVAFDNDVIDSLEVSFGMSGGRIKNVSAPGHLADVAIDDVEGDGLHEVVVLTGDWATQEVRIHRFTPARTLDLVQSLTPPVPATAVLLADEDGDGRKDILLSVPGSTSAVLVSHARQEGGFEPFAECARMPFALRGVRVADFNGDGHADLVASVDYGELQVLLSDGKGGFVSTGPRLRLQARGNMATHLGVADLDGDGALDLVGQAVGPLFSVRILYGVGDGTFTPSDEVFAATSEYFRRLSVVDTDGDGALDIVVLSHHELVVLHGDGVGGVCSISRLPLAEAKSDVIIQDYDGDGRQDAVISVYFRESPGLPLVHLHRGVPR